MNNGSTTLSIVKTGTRDPQLHQNEGQQNGHSINVHINTEHTNHLNGHRLISDIHQYAAYFQQKIERQLAANDIPETDRTAVEAVHFFKAERFPVPFNRSAAENQINLAVSHFSLYSFAARSHFGLGSLPGMMLVPLLESTLEISSDTKIEGAGITLDAQNVKLKLSEAFRQAAYCHDYGQERENPLWKIKLLSCCLALEEQIYSEYSKEILKTKMDLQTTLIADSSDSIAHYSLPERYVAGSKSEALEKLRLDITNTVSAITETVLGVIGEFDKRHVLLTEKGHGQQANTAYHDGMSIARKIHKASHGLRGRKV